jgi:uncharacterized protein YbjT (DUF2867 family)
MTILITGSRGAVASSLRTLLRERGIAARAASSNPARLSPRDGVPVVKCDLTDPATFPAALDGITSVFLYAASANIDAFVEQAVSAGVEHIVLLSSVSVLNPNAEHDRLAKSHLDVEKALAVSPIESTFLRPGSFAGNALGWSWAIKSSGAVNLPYPDAHTDPIHEADVAEAALAVLTEARLRGQSYTLSGPESVTFSEQIEQLARATARPITVNVVTRDEWKKEVAEYIHHEFADSLLDWWQSNDGAPVEVTRTIELLTGHPARGFDVWAEDHAADFTS